MFPNTSCLVSPQSPVAKVVGIRIARVVAGKSGLCPLIKEVDVDAVVVVVKAEVVEEHLAGEARKSLILLRSSGTRPISSLRLLFCILVVALPLDRAWTASSRVDCFIQLRMRVRAN